MKQILLFGAGKSATILIQYLLQQCSFQNWQLTLVDANRSLAESKIAGHRSGRALSFDIHDAESRSAIIRDASLVISLLPPSLHMLVAQDCIKEGKNMLTASYVDASMEALKQEISAKGLFFLCEMGLDPGIDHMSAKKLLDNIQQRGGKVVSFMSHCGGLVAREHDDNPWHYKISWNPRNVVHAGKDGAIFRQNGETVQWQYPQLFSEKRFVTVQDASYCWYPNRDSLHYIHVYGLQDCSTFVRTTLRHPDFIFGWKHVIELGLTDTEPVYQTDGMSLQHFFQQHFAKVDFNRWLEQKLEANLLKQEELFREFNEHVNQQSSSNERQKLQRQSAENLQAHLYESGLLLDQLSWLGISDGSTRIDKGLCSAADVLQFILERKLALKPGDRDLVVMLHQITYTLDGKTYNIESSMVLEGRDDVHTAMAKTVGMPLGIAAVLMLQGQLQLTGLHIPVIPEIYDPVLQKLEEEGIRFIEQEVFA